MAASPAEMHVATLARHMPLVFKADERPPLGSWSPRAISDRSGVVWAKPLVVHFYRGTCQVPTENRNKPIAIFVSFDKVVNIWVQFGATLGQCIGSKVAVPLPFFNPTLPDLASRRMPFYPDNV